MGLDGALTIVELNLGSYRHAYALAQVLPKVSVDAVDCWDDDAHPADGGLATLRSAEKGPAEGSRIRALRLDGSTLPLHDANYDAVVLGVGFHEFAEPLRGQLYREARRCLKPGGAIILFEHVRNLRNAIVFGPEIGHWPAAAHWREALEAHFDDVRQVRISPWLDLFVAHR